VGDPRDPGRRGRPALAAGRRRPSLGTRLRRALRPPRRLRPTRAGWPLLRAGLRDRLCSAQHRKQPCSTWCCRCCWRSSSCRACSPRRRCAAFASSGGLPFEWVAVAAYVSSSRSRMPSAGAGRKAIVVRSRRRAGRRGGACARSRLRAAHRTGRDGVALVPLRAVSTAASLRFTGFRVITRFRSGSSESLELPREAFVVVYPRIRRAKAARAAHRRSARARDAAGRGSFRPK